MNNDLISRSALKEELKKLNEMLPNLTDEKDKQSVRFAINILQDLIDNAPTVEPCYQTTSCLDCKNYDKDKHDCPRYCEVIKDALRSVGSERPKGEWIKIEPYPLQMHEFKCSECGYETDDCTDNFCSYCGARMRGEGK